MRLRSPHKDWKLDQLAVPDARAVGLDQMLTKLWLRIHYGNRPTTTRKEAYRRVVELAAKMENSRRAPAFVGFQPGDGVAESWLRADLLRVFKRSSDEFAVARPVHLPATRLRNTSKDDDSEASAILYKWLERAGSHVLEEVGDWISLDLSDSGEADRLDLPSYALARLAEDEEPDVTVKPPQLVPEPICSLQGQLYVEDVSALLAYRDHLPRAILVEHLQRLSALHLGLYLLRTYRAIADLAQSGASSCTACPMMEVASGSADCSVCPYKLELVADCGEDARSPTAQLAAASWLEQEEAISRYVRGHLTLRKFQELADRVGRRPLPTSTLKELAAVRAKSVKKNLDDRAKDLIDRLLSDAKNDKDGELEHLEDLKEQYSELGLEPFDVYMALLFHLSERRWFNYLRYLLDSLFMKNDSDGALRQPLGGRARTRRFALSAGIIETLALVAFVECRDGVWSTRTLPLHGFIDRLEERYGFLIAKPPERLSDDPYATRAMMDNNKLFRRRLRETGLFVDLSDAFLAQTLRPRVRIGET